MVDHRLSLKQIIVEASKRRLRGDVTAKERSVQMREAWGALNAWIDTQFRSGRGVHIPALGKLSWEIYTTNRNESRCRPLFILAENFARGFNIPYKRPVRPPVISPVEEINFSKLAIKFSQTLTKDGVFSSLRDIFNGIGTMVGRGDRVSVPFVCGRLVAQNKKLTFVFDVQYLLRTRAAEDDSKFDDLVDIAGSLGKADPGASGSANNEGEDRRDYGLDGVEESFDQVKAESRGSSNNNVDETDDKGDGDAAERPATSFGGGGAEDDGLEAGLEDGGFEAGQQQPARLGTSASLPPLKLKGLSSSGYTSSQAAANEATFGGSPHDGGGDSAYLDYDGEDDGYMKEEATGGRLVMEEAYSRHLARINSTYDAEERENELMEKYRQEGEAQETQKRRRMKRDQRDLQAYIKKQMDLRKSERKREITERRQFSRTTVYPRWKVDNIEEGNNDTCGARPDSSRVAVQAKHELLASLQAQMNDKLRRNRAEREQMLEEERRYLDHIHMEMDINAQMKRDHAESQRRDLIQAWHRDQQLKDHQKVRKTRLVTRLKEMKAHPGSKKTAAAGASKPGMGSMGVGYDMRSARNNEG